MKTVSQYIFEALTRRTVIHLPNLGWMEVRRRKAKKVSDTKIIPPQNVVVFSDEQIVGAVNIVSVMTAEEGVKRADIQKRYNTWMKSANEDGTLRIHEVGEIKDGKFIVSEKLHNAINPDKVNIVTMEREQKIKCGGCSVFAWVLVAVLAVVLLAGIVWAARNGHFECGKKDGKGQRTEQRFDGRGDRDGRGEGRHGEGCECPKCKEFKGERRHGEGCQCHECTGEKTITADELTVTESDTTVTTVKQGTEAAAQPATPAQYHVIAGTYSIESNADALIKRVKREHPELNPIKLTQPSTGWTMVSIFQAPTERQAFNTMNRYWDIDLYMWIYEG